MLYDFFKLHNFSDVVIIETIDNVNIKIEKDDLDEQYILNLYDLVNKISDRDSFEFSLEINGNSIRNATYVKKDIKAHIIEHKEDEEHHYELELKITKTLQNSIISIYFLDYFVSFCEDSNLFDFIGLISGKIDNYLQFEVFQEIEQFRTESILFNSYNNLNSTNVHEVKRDNKLKLFKENSHIQNINIDLLPSDFFLIKKSENSKLNDLFNKITSLLSLAFIVNTFNVKSGNISFKINGYKTIVENNLDIDALIKKNELLYKIFNWAYEGGNSSDKVGLVRNVLSLHIDSNGHIIFDDEVWDAIESNYKIYLNGNIQSYLEVKNKIGEFIVELSSKTYKMADEILDTFKNNILVLITFLLTVVLVNGFKNNGIDNIFSNTYLYIVFLLSVITSLWFMAIKKELLNRFDSSTSNIKKILILNYKKVIMEAEINDTIQPIIDDNKIYLKNQIKRYQNWWYGIITVFLLLFIIGNYIFKNESTENHESGDKEQLLTISSLIKKEKNYLDKIYSIDKEISTLILDENKKIKKELEYTKKEINKLIQERELFKDKITYLKKKNHDVNISLEKNFIRLNN